MAAEVQENNYPTYGKTARTARAVATNAAANVNTDTPTGIVLLLTAGAKGAIITRLTAIPRASLASPAGLVVFLAKSGDAYAAQSLFDSEVMPAQNLTAGSKALKTAFPDYSETRPLRLEAGDRLYVGTQVAGNIVFKAEFTDF